MLQLKDWVMIKQSPNLELKTWFLVWNNVKTHAQEQPQGSKTHKKKSTVRLTYRINVLQPPKVSSLQVLGLV